MKTQRFKIYNNAQNFDHDCMKTVKIKSDQFKSSGTLEINGVKVRQPEDSMNLFVQAILDMQIKKQNNGVSRMEKDVQDMLNSFKRNPEQKEKEKENDRADSPLKRIKLQKENSDYIQSPMRTQNLEKGNYSTEAIQLFAQNKHFLKSYQQLSIKILQNIDPKKSLFTQQKWKQILESLYQAQVYLTIKERLQLIKTIYYLIKVQFGIPFTEKQREIHLLTQRYPLNEYNFCEQMAYELSKFKTKILHRQNQTAKVLELMEGFSQLKMDFSELSNSTEFTKSQNDKDKKFDERVFELCKKDIYAFSFLTLYLSNCINLELKKQPQKVFELIEKLKVILTTLSLKYPPNSTANEQIDNDPENVKLIIDDSFKKGNLYVPRIRLKKAPSVEEKVITIESQIIQKARIAKSNKLMFDKVLRPLCQKIGKNYQSGLKIRTDSVEDRLSRARAFEKIVFKNESDGLNKFEKLFDNQKQFIMEIFMQNAKSFNKILAFNQTCFTELNHLRNQHVLKGKEEVPFEVFDLLRAKAVFQKPSDIIKTANDIYNKFDEIKSGYYNLVQYDDRLDKNTKDFQLNFLINGTMSELLLTLKLDKSANEFNHKLYELRRSKNLTPLITLQTINDQLAEKFLIEQLQLCYIIKEYASKKKERLKDSLKLKQFEKLVLMNVSEVDEEGEKQLEELVFSVDRDNHQQAIDGYLSMANSFVQSNQGSKYNKDMNFKRDQLREANQRLCFNEIKY